MIWTGGWRGAEANGSAGSIDPAKRAAWPRVVVAVRNRWKCDVALLVIAPDARVARWASQPVPAEVRGGSIRPLVLGSEAFPRREVSDLAGHPQATVLRALIHCRDRKDLPLFLQVMDDVRMLPSHERVGYYRGLQRHLSPSTLTFPEVAMIPIEMRYYQALIDKARAEGRAMGRAKALAEAEAEDKASMVRIIRRQLGRLVALPGPEALAKMEALPIEALKDLAEDLLDFSGPDDLDGWLAGH